MRTAENDLWAAVLLQAVRDATMRPSVTSSMPEVIRLRDDSRAWLLGMSPGFKQICEAAGFHPESVQRGCAQLAAAQWPPIRNAPELKVAA